VETTSSCKADPNGEQTVPVLVAAVAVVGALCLIDLLLTLGVIRRLREHTEMITRLNVPEVPVIGLAAGESPAAFSAVTVSGDPVSGPAGLRLAAFFSSSCSMCPERVPPFIQYLADHQIAKEHVLTVVLGSDDEPPAYLDRLAEVTLACAHGEDSDVAKAFKAVGFPAFCLLNVDGAVLATSYDPAMLPEPAMAR
jgi:hypothetical protein